MTTQLMRWMCLSVAVVAAVSAFACAERPAPTGSETQVIAKTAGQEICALFRERHDLQPGQPLALKPNLDVIHLFDAESGQHL